VKRRPRENLLEQARDSIRSLASILVSLRADVCLQDGDFLIGSLDPVLGVSEPHQIDIS